jgi:hypothetical protein
MASSSSRPSRSWSSNQANVRLYRLWGLYRNAEEAQRKLRFFFYGLGVPIEKKKTIFAIQLSRLIDSLSISNPFDQPSSSSTTMIQKQPQSQETHNKLIISYLTLRRSIGWLGLILPACCLLYGIATAGDVERSISTYYHTELRNIFVGILCVLGTFLVTYNGYDWKESAISTIGGVFAIATAFFPTNVISMWENKPTIDPIVDAIHLSSAAGLFLVFAYMSLALFTRDYAVPTGKGFLGLFRDKQKEIALGLGHLKIKRNKAYRFCGWSVTICIALMLLNKVFNVFPNFPFTFWGEAASLVAFGASWLVKGQQLLTEPYTKANLLPHNP